MDVPILSISPKHLTAPQGFFFPMFLGKKDKTEQLCPVEQGRPVSQSENMSGRLSKKKLDRASLLSEAVYRNAQIWGLVCSPRMWQRSQAGLYPCCSGRLRLSLPLLVLRVLEQLIQPWHPGTAPQQHGDPLVSTHRGAHSSTQEAGPLREKQSFKLWLF